MGKKGQRLQVEGLRSGILTFDLGPSRMDTSNSSKKCFSIQQAQDEAERCLLCHDAPCSKACPAGTDPGLFIRKLRMKNVTGAIRTIKENNIVGGTCGILCPTAELCEKACVACGIDRCIRIGQIQRALVEHSWSINFKPLKCESTSKNFKVAIIGSGPAGLSCAAELAKKGVAVTIFEQHPEAGGVLRYGVPEHRFSKKFLQREIADVKELGVEFVFSKVITQRNGAEELLKKGFQAVFVATGLWEPVPLFKEKTTMGGWFSSTQFLMKAKDETKQIFSGKVVTVIGGGSVAIDCAETAQRLGARDIYLVYRRSFTEMPAELKERESALNSGIHFMLLNQPVEYIADDKRQIRGIKLLRTQLGEPDASGRRRPVEIAGSEWMHETDIVIEAIGSQPQEQRIIADPETGRPNVKGIYAGGDIVRGPALIVNAVRDGKVAAKTILEDLQKTLSSKF